MENLRAGRCQGCGERRPMLRVAYDWQRTQKDGAWLWLGTPRALCSGCFDDPRLRARWIDERQKQTPAKPMWAKDEPEVLAAPEAVTAAPAAARRGTRAKQAAPPQARRKKTGARSQRKKTNK